MRWSLLPVCLCTLAMGAQTGDSVSQIPILARIKRVMLDTLSRQPNYTCIQQIERSYRRLPQRKFELHDVLRLEVALVEGKEMFAWPGSRAFEQSDLTEMVSGGAIGTGDFALHARAVFETSAPVFRYVGADQVLGRRAVRFDFVVPLIGSGYRIKARGLQAIVGYHGSFWADAETLELARLEVNADDIPPELGIRSARDVMDYGRIRIGASEFLLPEGSELGMVDLSGNESRNRTRFKSCRQYTGESVLTFADAPSSEGAAATPTTDFPKQEIEIPPGTMLDVRLTTEVDSTSSAVGDPVTATLNQTLKARHQLMFAKGAHLLGRIARLERDGEYVTLDLEFSEIESHDRRAPLRARIEALTSIAPFAATRSFANAAQIAPDGRGGIQLRTGRIHLRSGSYLQLRNIAGAPR